MEFYGRYEPNRPLLARIGSGKIHQDERLFMVLPINVFGEPEEFLENDVSEGLKKIILEMDSSPERKQCILNEDAEGGITLAPYESVKDLLYGDSKNVSNSVYLASASPNGPPRVNLQSRLRDHVAYNDGKDGEATEFNILNLVINTEKDIQGI